MKHGRANPKPRRASTARFAATVALQTPEHPRLPIRDRYGPRPYREGQAAAKFRAWRIQHPNASADDLRHRWRQIRVDWNLSTAPRTPR